MPSGPSTPTSRMGFGSAFAQVRCDHRPEVVHPAPDGLIGDHDPAFRQQIFDVAEAQREPNIKPDRLLDDFGREAVAAIADLGHHRWLRLKVTDGKPAGDVTMPANLLSEIFTPAAIASGLPEESVTADTGTANLPKASASQKLVIFTEHRDTLSYLEQRISTLLGRKEAVVCIHGGMGREERMKTQESFRHDPEVTVLLATDAAGEGINLQRAHLMVNYDLPWNPNRIEQRFGRIHRIGQTEA